MWMRIQGISAQPVLQSRSQVTQSKRARRVLREISLGEHVKLLITYDGAEPDEVFVEAGEDPKPIRTTIDFKAFYRAKPVVGLDDFFCDLLHGFAAQCTLADAFVRVQRRGQRLGELALQFKQVHCATTANSGTLEGT